jgi:hypothetical protein
MDNATPLDHTVRAHHLRHWEYGSDLHDWDAGLFEFGRDRSTAASGSASSGGENHGVDARLL